jgi:hypothetical protein
MEFIPGIQSAVGSRQSNLEFGTLELWNIGTLEHWNIGTLKQLIPQINTNLNGRISL